MLFNCLQCCKAISTRVTQCPYCRIDTAEMVNKLALTRDPEPMPVAVQALDKEARASARPGTLVYRALAHVGQIVQVMRAPREGRL